MGIYNVDISSVAEIDLREIIQYISNQFSAPTTAMEMLNAMENAIFSLSEFPQRFPLVGDERLFQLGIRKLTVKNYLVFYSIDEEGQTVNFIRILYARRNWLRIL
ncbi:MAG: type II toxin-antitoxin system RelE/ParE family toxin [Turicibacter sp.]|nr:type II toxin-antitoxin system RelE/ParE family toxin [Turicibacter sp.]